MPPCRCRVSVAHIRQSGLDSGPGFQAKAHKTIEVCSLFAQKRARGNAGGLNILSRQPRSSGVRPSKERRVRWSGRVHPPTLTGVPIRDSPMSDSPRQRYEYVTPHLKKSLSWCKINFWRIGRMVRVGGPLGGPELGARRALRSRAASGRACSCATSADLSLREGRGQRVGVRG